jgi:hypothetical protein
MRCIRHCIEYCGEGPTILEIGVAVGLRSNGSVAYHLRNREERGVLIRDGRNRHITWRLAR